MDKEGGKSLEDGKKESSKKRRRFLSKARSKLRICSKKSERDLIRIRAIQGQRRMNGVLLFPRGDIGWIKPIDFLPIIGIREVNPLPRELFREGDSG